MLRPDAAQWWNDWVASQAVAPDASRDSDTVRRADDVGAARRLLASGLQREVRRSILAHPSAHMIFTTVRGGTPEDRRAIDRAASGHRLTGLSLWADASLALEPSDPLRSVCAAHARILQGQFDEAAELLRRAIGMHAEHPRRHVLWQNLGLAESLRGAHGAALDAFRSALTAASVVDQVVAACSICIAGSKLRSAADVGAGAAVLMRLTPDRTDELMRRSIQGRRGRGEDNYWRFDRSDVKFLREHAPTMGVTDSWIES